MSEGLRVSERAPGLLLGDDVQIGASVSIGANVVIHGGARIGEGCVVQDGAIIGKRPRLSPRSTAKAPSETLTVLGEGASVLAGAVICAGAQIGDGVIIGDQAHVRERCLIGTGTVLGRGSGLENDVAVGARVKIQSSCYITAHSNVEDDVFVAPGVVTTNDNTMGRRGVGQQLEGAMLRRACRVGGGAVLCPGVEIGVEAFVGAGAVVTADVPSRTVVVGVPARVLRRVADDELLAS